MRTPVGQGFGGEIARDRKRRIEVAQGRSDHGNARNCAGRHRWSGWRDRRASDGGTGRDPRSA
ncbi:hypothetical protein bcere0022_47890 [Bacillus cereus Rock3-44]|nr:hypothetical protein bcere0022_47890 [Bacillus cereus Rock3-44]